MPTSTPASRAFAERVQVVMELTSRLNVLPHNDVDTRNALLGEIFGRPLPASVAIYPPFFCDYGLGATFGERVFINQGCHFLDLGGITLGDRVLVGPNVTLTTGGHPVEVTERFDFLTHAPIVVEDDVWIGASATIAPGVTIGRGSVVGAGTVVAKDVPAMTVVTSAGHVVRRSLRSPTQGIDDAAIRARRPIEEKTP
ncbi:sugar O-acetyltransferase [Mumia sp. zg.B21]|uniref:sugar O-acetyltransferase n=1 Tax=Mumia sp. zg.B21 TaxID=2855447 RepID=UPI0021076A71|nr:sugar O-acetyltransferase [Mumia sp. zg.B21]